MEFLQILTEDLGRICARAQGNEAYHSSISTIFDLAQKWIHRSLDAAGDVNQATSFDAFIDDPTPNKHLIPAIRGLRQFIQRLAGDTSLDGFFAMLRVCGVDIQQDPAARGWCDKFIAHLRKSLDEGGYVRSDEAQRTRQDLQRAWKELLGKRLRAASGRTTSVNSSASPPSCSRASTRVGTCARSVVRVPR